MSGREFSGVRRRHGHRGRVAAAPRRAANQCPIPSAPVGRDGDDRTGRTGRADGRTAVGRAGPGHADRPADTVGCTVQPVHADRAQLRGRRAAGRLRRALRVHRRRRPQLVGPGRGALRGHPMCGRHRRRDAEQRMGFSVLGERSNLVTDYGLAHLSTDYGRTWRDADRRSSPYPRSRRRPDRSPAGSACAGVGAAGGGPVERNGVPPDHPGAHVASAVQPLPGSGRQHLGHVPDRRRPGVDRRAQRRPRRDRSAWEGGDRGGRSRRPRSTTARDA